MAPDQARLHDAQRELHLSLQAFVADRPSAVLREQPITPAFRTAIPRRIGILLMSNDRLFVDGLEKLILLKM